MYFNHGTRQSKGVAIFTSEQSGLELTNIENDSDRRWIKGEMEWENSVLSIASVYAPNESYTRSTFFDSLCDQITDNYIVGGDFNSNTLYCYG